MEYTVPLLTYFLGLVLGNRLAIGRDRRKEFNEVAIPLHKKLTLYLNTGTPNETPSIQELAYLSNYMPFWKKYIYNRKIIQLKNEIELEVKASSWDDTNQILVVESWYKPRKDYMFKKILKYLERN